MGCRSIASSNAWWQAGRRLVTINASQEALQALIGITTTVLLVWSYSSRSTTHGGAVVLLAFWALNLPLIGQEMSEVFRESLHIIEGGPLS